MLIRAVHEAMCDSLSSHLRWRASGDGSVVIPVSGLPTIQRRPSGRRRRRHGPLTWSCSGIAFTINDDPISDLYDLSPFGKKLDLVELANPIKQPVILTTHIMTFHVEESLVKYQSGAVERPRG